MNTKSQITSCSEHSQNQAVDPVGTAGTYDEYFLLETPLPWASDVWDSKGIPVGIKDLFEQWAQRGRKFRAMGIAPEPKHHVEGSRILIHYKIGSSANLSFDRTMYRIPEADLETVLENVFNNEMNSLQPLVLNESGNREFFVCTHGARDTCCGKKGFPLYQTLKDQGLDAWRISHTGGHRFAPTCIDFPTGHYWAWLNDDAMSQIVSQTGSTENLGRHYRGHSNLGKAEQVIEREFFIQKGWSAWENVRKITPGPGLLQFQLTATDQAYAVKLEELPPILSRSKCSSEVLKSYPQYHVLSFEVVKENA
jgi:hypothetical protein